MTKEADASMLVEIREQPGLLRSLQSQTLPRLAQMLQELTIERSTERIWLVGCGDMAFAAEAAAAVSEQLGARGVRALRSMDMRWVAARLGPQDLVVGASISGRTPRTREALLLARAAGAVTLAVTDGAVSPLAQEAERTLLLKTADAALLGQHEYAGYAAEVPQTRTYVAVLAVFLQVAGALGNQTFLPSDLASRLEDFLLTAEREAQRLAHGMLEQASPRRVLVLGSGPYRSIASYGAAKLLEYAIPAQAQCLEELHHLEMFVLEEGDWLVAVLPDEASASRWREVRGRHRSLGARSVEWSSSAPLSGGGEGLSAALPGGGMVVAAFQAAVALQLQAFHLARGLGRDVERWVGGQRRDEIFRLSQATIRDSEIRLVPPQGQPGRT